MRLCSVFLCLVLKEAVSKNQPVIFILQLEDDLALLQFPRLQLHILAGIADRPHLSIDMLYLLRLERNHLLDQHPGHKAVGAQALHERHLVAEILRHLGIDMHPVGVSGQAVEHCQVVSHVLGHLEVRGAVGEGLLGGFEGRAAKAPKGGMVVITVQRGKGIAGSVINVHLESFGKVDFLVNNAAIGEMQTLESVTDDRIDAILLTNIKGPMVYCREALKYMIDQNSGSIVNVSSINGIRPLCGIAYSSSKGGINTFTEALAIYLVGIGANVRVNALCPGFTYSPTALHHDAVPHTLRDGMMNAIRDARSVRRDDVRATPEEQANAALFLVSDMSAAVTGITLKTDHGSYL